MKDAQDLIPWKVTALSIRPFDDFWSFNPSVHFDGETWRCVLRCADYCMPEGITKRSKNVRSGQQTKNAMVILDPTTWKPIQIFKMHERDGLPRASTPHVGFEDMRIFRTDKGGLQGIAASLHLARDRDQWATDSGMPQHQPPEQVVLSFDAEYNISKGHPIRGGWGGAQKNWVPFDNCEESRFLYAIEKGALFGEDGPLHGDAARVRPSTCALFDDRGPLHGEDARVRPSTQSALPSVPLVARPELLPEPPPESLPEPPQKQKKTSRRKPPMVRGGDMRIVRGGRIKLDAMASRPSSRPSSRSSSRLPARSTDDSTRLMGSGRILMPTYEGLRGGTQLVRVADGEWLGIGHEMKWTNNKKFYWHVFYTVDDRGKMMGASEPMKFSPKGIEFAAGMAIDGDRVVISFGVDDMECKLAETSLSAVMDILRPIAR